jgi:hypothetical protein
MSGRSNCGLHLTFRGSLRAIAAWIELARGRTLDLSTSTLPLGGARSADETTLLWPPTERDVGDTLRRVPR